jgi:2-hydroxy-3-oxopropionate reductase
MLTRNYTPGFKAQLHQKDMHIVQQFAAEQGIDLPSTDLVTGYINALVEVGLGEQDSAAMATLFENKAGVKFGGVE